VPYRFIDSGEETTEFKLHPNGFAGLRAVGRGRVSMFPCFRCRGNDFRATSAATLKAVGSLIASTADFKSLSSEQIKQLAPTQGMKGATPLARASGVGRRESDCISAQVCELLRLGADAREGAWTALSFLPSRILMRHGSWIFWPISATFWCTARPNSQGRFSAARSLHLLRPPLEEEPGPPRSSPPCNTPE